MGEAFLDPKANPLFAAFRDLTEEKLKIWVDLFQYTQSDLGNEIDTESVVPEGHG